LAGALWAINGINGEVLNGGKPLVITGDNIRMAPSADGGWVYLIDDSGNFYGYTVDKSVAAIATQTPVHVTSTLKFHDR
jgi:hypothetical protein